MSKGCVRMFGNYFGKRKEGKMLEQLWLKGSFIEMDADLCLTGEYPHRKGDSHFFKKLNKFIETLRNKEKKYKNVPDEIIRELELKEITDAEDARVLGIKMQSYYLTWVEENKKA